MRPAASSIPSRGPQFAFLGCFSGILRGISRHPPSPRGAPCPEVWSRHPLEISFLRGWKREDAEGVGTRLRRGVVYKKP